jgi:hypothetical protein
MLLSHDSQSARHVFQFILSVKGKVSHITGYESLEEKQRYSSALSLTSALDGGGSYYTEHVTMTRTMVSVLLR